MRVLVLGGTTEASALASLLAADPRFDATLSLAGRTSNPRPQPLTTRVGSLGGVEGLARWLRDEKADAVIDAVKSKKFWITTHDDTPAAVTLRTRSIIDGTNPPQLMH